MTKKKQQKKTPSSSQLPSGSNNNGGKQSLTEHEIQMVFLEEQEIDQLFSTMSLKRKPIAKDGACLFRAFSDLYYGTQIYHDRVRKSCIEYMKEHENFFKDFIFEMDFNSYIKFMSKPTSWGSQLELEALASLYKVNITVYGVNGILTEHKGDPTLEAQDVKNQWKTDISISDILRQKKSEKIEPKKRKDIRLAYLYGSHYDSVYPANEFMNAIIVQDIFYETFMEPFKNDLFQKKVGTYKNVEYDAWLDELEKMEKKSLQKVKELLYQHEKSYDLSDPKEFPQLEKQSSSAILPSSLAVTSELETQAIPENGESSTTLEEKPQNAWLTQEKPNWAAVATTPVENETSQPAALNESPQSINTSTTSNGSKDVKQPPVSQSHSLTVKMPENPQDLSKKKVKGNQNKSKKSKNSATQPAKEEPKETISNGEHPSNNNQNTAQQQPNTPQQQHIAQFIPPPVGYPNIAQQPFSPPSPPFMGQHGVFQNQPPFHPFVMMPPPGSYPNNGMILIPSNLVPPNFVPHYPIMPPPQVQPMMGNLSGTVLSQQPVVVSHHQPIPVTEPPKPVSAWSAPLQSNSILNSSLQTSPVSSAVTHTQSSSITVNNSVATLPTTTKSDSSTPKKNTRKKK